MALRSFHDTWVVPNPVLWQLTSIYRTLARVLRDGESRYIGSNQVSLRLSEEFQTHL